MRNLILFASCLLLLVSCSSPQQQTHTDTHTDTISKQQKPPVVSGTVGDTLVIAGKVAVIYQPDSIQIAKAKKENEDDFYTVADDYVYFMSDAARYMDSMRCQVLYTHEEQYLEFVNTDGSTVWIKKDTLPNLWGMYLFDGKKPQDVEMTNIIEEYKNFFH